MNAAEGLTEAMERVAAALTAMRSGNPQPYLDCWAKSPEATLFGAWGPIEHGWKDVTDTFQWVAGRFTGGTVEVEHSVVASSGDLAYTIGFKRGPASVGGTPRRRWSSG